MLPGGTLQKATHHRAQKREKKGKQSVASKTEKKQIGQKDTRNK